MVQMNLFTRQKYSNKCRKQTYSYHGWRDGASLVAHGKESSCQCWRWKRRRFDPWNRKWQPTPVCLPGKSHKQRSLAGYSPWGRKGTEWAPGVGVISVFSPLQEGFDLQVASAFTDNYPPDHITSSLAINERPNFSIWTKKTNCLCIFNFKDLWPSFLTSELSVFEN